MNVELTGTWLDSFRSSSPCCAEPEHIITATVNMPQHSAWSAWSDIRIYEFMVITRARARDGEEDRRAKKGKTAAHGVVISTWGGLPDHRLITNLASKMTPRATGYRGIVAQASEHHAHGMTTPDQRSVDCVGLVSLKKKRRFLFPFSAPDSGSLRSTSTLHVAISLGSGRKTIRSVSLQQPEPLMHLELPFYDAVAKRVRRVEGSLDPIPGSHAARGAGQSVHNQDV